MKKTIGITQRIFIDKNGVLCEYLEKEYVEYYSKFFNLIPISNFTNNLNQIIKQFDIKGFILTGGNNLDKKYYINNENIKDNFKQRDDKEFEILDYSIKHNLKILGTCRGCQIINSYFKGKIEKLDKNIHIAQAHKVNINNNQLSFNSYHEFGITKNNIGENLIIKGICELDNSIEYIEHNKNNITGIMWHPERKKIKQDNKFNTQLIKKIFEI